MRDTTLAYLAGLIDADGCITIQGTGLRANLVPVVHVSNTDVELLQWLLATFGGHLSLIRQGNDRHRAFGRWNIRGQLAVDLLAKLRPHLRVKRHQAWLAQEFWAQRQPFKMGRAKLPVEILALRLGYHAAMHELNRTGPVKGRLSLDNLKPKATLQGALLFSG